MKNINLKGITKESVIGVALLLLSLVNAVLQMIGLDTIPIASENVSEVISIVFLIATTLYNTYKNRNISTASQKAQEITDAIKSGELLIDEVDEIVQVIKKKK